MVISSELPGVLIVADRRQKAVWLRAEERERSLRQEGRQVLLRDATEMEITLDFIHHITEVTFLIAHVHVFRSLYAVLCGFYKIGEAICMEPLPLFVLQAFREIQGVTTRTEPEPLPGEIENAPAPPKRESLYASALVISQDLMPHSAKTSEVILQACRALGIPASIHDGAVLRLMADIDGALLADAQDAWARARPRVRELYARALREQVVPGGPGAAVLSLDLNWFFDHDLFLEDPAVARIFSFWFDDPKAWCAYPNVFFPGTLERFQEALCHPKVVHCCYGRGQMEELRALGVGQTRLSFLAAPPEYLRHRRPPEITARAAFLGNPGLRIPPPPSIVALMEKGAGLEAIRVEARSYAMAQAQTYLKASIAREPTVRDWLVTAFIMRAANPYVSATALLVKAAREFPRALEAINEAGQILNAALFIKMGNQFDRPALVHRLWKAGLVDVYSAAGEWKNYGVDAAPEIRFPDLPVAYQRYACHLNGYNSMRDATANEKLFEIAACGRVSVNLLSPDVRRCYADGEVACGETLEEVEERVRGFLADPDEALAWGDRARRRTATHHLWTHRMRDLLCVP